MYYLHLHIHIHIHIHIHDNTYTRLEVLRHLAVAPPEGPDGAVQLGELLREVLGLES